MSKYIKIIIILFLLNSGLQLLSSEKNYVVVIGSFSKLYFAEIQQQDAIEAGFKSELLKMNTKVGVMYRVTANKPLNKSLTIDILNNVQNKLKIKNAWLLAIYNKEYLSSLYDSQKRKQAYEKKNLTQKSRKSKEQKDIVNNEKESKTVLTKKVDEKSIINDIKNKEKIDNKEIATVKKSQTISSNDKFEKETKIIKGEAKESRIINNEQNEIQSDEKKENENKKAEIKNEAGKDEVDSNIDKQKSKDKNIENEIQKEKVVKAESIENKEQIKDNENAKEIEVNSNLEKQKSEDEIKEVDSKNKELVEDTDIIEEKPQESDIKASEKTIDIADSRHLIDEKKKTDEEMAKIDWDDFDLQFRAFLKAMIRKDFDYVQKHIDENGFLAIRDSEEGKTIDHFLNISTLIELLKYYSNELNEEEFIYTLKYYDIKIIRRESLPVYNCSDSYFNKNGLFKNEINPYDEGLKDIIDNSSTYSIDPKVNNILSSTNIKVVRTQKIFVKAMYFTYYDGKLWLRFIDFSDYCN